jgi:multidrug resistance efflux pump
MSFDQNALDSLRIDRKPEPANTGSSNMAKWIIGAVLLLAIVAGAYALLREDAIEVETATAVASSSTPGSGAAVLNASGYVVARRQATVSSKVTGKVAEVLIEEGMAVKEGQMLARLDDTTMRPVYSLAQRQLEATRKNLEEVQIRVAEAERNLRRSQELRKDKLVSEQALDQAQSEAAALQARLEALKSEVQVAEGTVRVRAQDLDDLLVRAHAHRSTAWSCRRTRSLGKWCHPSRPVADSRVPASPRSSTWTRARSKWMSTKRSSTGSRRIRRPKRCSTRIPTG